MSKVPSGSLCNAEMIVELFRPQLEHQTSYFSHQPSSDCRPDGTMYHGFSLKVAVLSKVAILECISPEIFTKGRLLANKCLKMYSELLKNPPFPAWKDGLDELWN